MGSTMHANLESFALSASAMETAAATVMCPAHGSTTLELYLLATTNADAQWYMHSMLHSPWKT